MASDHTPTICCLNVSSMSPANKRYDYTKADWRSFRSIIDTEIESLQTPNMPVEIDYSLECFSKITINAQQRCIPMATHINKPQINPFAKQLIGFKKTLHRQMTRLTDLNARKHAKTTINRLQKEIRKYIVADHNAFWDKELT